jgi:Uma2 family endonuclease
VPADDDNVVRVMVVSDYFRGRETSRRRELIWGVVREPPAPFWDHQAVVTRLTRLVGEHVERRGLGHVCVSPIDVVLDRDLALVVQPDVIFVSNGRLDIIDQRVWGAPDLAIEVLSPGTAWRDRTIKLRWYRRYGVRECWVVDPIAKQVDVVTFQGTRIVRRRHRGSRPIRSTVLPGIDLSSEGVFR